MVIIDSTTIVNKENIRVWAIYLGKYTFIGKFKKMENAIVAKEDFIKKFTISSKKANELLLKNKNNKFNKKIVE